LSSHPSPLISWTPSDRWLGLELARRGLVARIDGGRARAASTDGEGWGRGRLRIEEAGDSDGRHLLIHLGGRRAALSLEPVVVAGNRWREAWAIELFRGDSERWTLTAGGPPAEIDDARRSPLRARLVICRRTLVAPGIEEGVPIVDRAFHRYTRQSSAGAPRPGTPEERALAWAAPTLPEQAPYWEIDLGRSYFLQAAAIDLLDPPAGARLRVTGYAFPTPRGGPPPGSPQAEPPLEGRSPGDGGLARASLWPGWVARYVRLELLAPEGTTASLALGGCELQTAGLFGGSLRATWRRALAVHRDRVMFMASEREGAPYGPSLRYGEAAAQARALARALARRLEQRPGSPAPAPQPRLFFVLATRNRPEWVIADIAAVERGYVVVPVSPDEPEERLAGILARCRPSAMLVDARDEARLTRLATETRPPVALVIVCGEGEDRFRKESFHPDSTATRATFEQLVGEGTSGEASGEPDAPERPQGDLYTLLFTSGSTGAPKGAMRSYAEFHAMLPMYSVAQPAFHLSFQPLSHLSERMYLPAVLLHGGAVAFSRGALHLMDELRAFEPTALGSVPRLYDVLYAAYRRRLRAGVGEADAAAAARGAFGQRLSSLSVGSAPVSPEVLAFLRRTFTDIWVTEGYGTTEVGTIATDGRVAANVEVKLVPVAGAAAPLRPGGEPGGGAEEPAQGEIWVRTPHVISGYFGEESASLLDADGFFPTGDLGERGADGTVRVVGRLKGAVKLAQGEFVSSERIEAALSAAALVDRVFVHVEAGAAGVAALVVPSRDSLAAALGAGGEPLERLILRDDAAPLVLAALQSHGRGAGLAPHELPRGVVLEAAQPSVEGGLVTASGKLARGALAARYGARLAAAAGGNTTEGHEGIAGEGIQGTQGNQGSWASARLARVASSLLGRRVSPGEPLVEALDSLSAAALMAALAEELGRPVPLEAWFASSTLDELARRLSPITTGNTRSALALEAERELARPLRFGRLTPADRGPGGGRGASARRGPVLLTGATGLLGAHLVEALLARTELEIVCAIRAADDGAAGARLRQAADRYELATPLGERVRAIAADLAAPRLGLGERGFEALAGQVGAVLHAGAAVSWLAPFAALRGANVDGTLALLELAAMGGGLAMHLVSTISTAPADGDEGSLLSVDEAARASPYALSKWLAEHHARRAAALGLPLAVYRPAMIAPHSGRGLGNPDDFIHRYLVGCAELGLYLDIPDQRLDMTPVDHVAQAIVALVSSAPQGGDTAHIVNVEQSMTYAELGRALGAAGVRAAPVDYATFRGALLSRGNTRGARGDALRALGGYFPEEGFSLGMGPWPSARTRARLASLGVCCPRIDVPLVGRVVEAMRARGLLAGSS
jgi:fatty acid CoA ligase FadD9